MTVGADVSGNKCIVVGNCSGVFGLEVFGSEIGILSRDDVLPFFAYGHYSES